MRAVDDEDALLLSIHDKDVKETHQAEHLQHEEEEEEESFALDDTDNDAPHQAKYLQPRVLGSRFGADSHMIVETDFHYDFNGCLIVAKDLLLRLRFRFQMHRIGMVVRFFNFSIVFFTVLFIAIVVLVIFSVFFSPRLWLSNGC